MNLYLLQHKYLQEINVVLEDRYLICAKNEKSALKAVPDELNTLDRVINLIGTAKNSVKEGVILTEEDFRY